MVSRLSDQGGIVMVSRAFGRAMLVAGEPTEKSEITNRPRRGPPILITMRFQQLVGRPLRGLSPYSGSPSLHGFAPVATAGASLRDDEVRQRLGAEY
jgi:hypothetical protein